MTENIVRKPSWLKIKLPKGTNYTRVKSIVQQHNLHTICTSGRCPNMGECWAAGTATLMIMGDICTRSCKFCATQTGKPLPLDRDEPVNVAKSIALMGLKHAVITSVDRDDLPDKGAGHWAKTITEIKRINPQTTMEVLIPDFDGNALLIKQVIDARPEIISHNLETVKRLTPMVRSRAKYEVSLQVIQTISGSGILSKSGIMVGLGETRDEILETMDDLLKVGCHVFTIGQYLQPAKSNLPVAEYIHPDVFEEYRHIGLAKGFKKVESAPLVRSSYHAERHL
ncbi:MAG TPA: lipoyl synthase [Prolixibacteraceae bacterium]|nr:lipoyl synthase [Prolixibacteraceae bacterium]HPS12537.1 lipoyl synthase [Prolixibacteraceae bacterium]